MERSVEPSEVCLMVCQSCTAQRLEEGTPRSTTNTPFGEMKRAVRFHFILFPSQRGELRTSPLAPKGSLWEEETDGEAFSEASEVCLVTEHKVFDTACCRRLTAPHPEQTPPAEEGIFSQTLNSEP